MTGARFLWLQPLFQVKLRIGGLSVGSLKQHGKPMTEGLVNRKAGKRENGKDDPRPDAHSRSRIHSVEQERTEAWGWSQIELSMDRRDSRKIGRAGAAWGSWRALKTLR